MDVIGEMSKLDTYVQIKDFTEIGVLVKSNLPWVTRSLFLIFSVASFHWRLRQVDTLILRGNLGTVKFVGSRRWRRRCTFSSGVRD